MDLRNLLHNLLKTFPFGHDGAKDYFVCLIDFFVYLFILMFIHILFMMQTENYPWFYMFYNTLPDLYHEQFKYI